MIYSISFFFLFIVRFFIRNSLTDWWLIKWLSVMISIYYMYFGYRNVVAWISFFLSYKLQIYTIREKLIMVFPLMNIFCDINPLLYISLNKVKRSIFKRFVFIFCYQISYYLLNIRICFCLYKLHYFKEIVF